MYVNVEFVSLFCCCLVLSCSDCGWCVLCGCVFSLRCLWRFYCVVLCVRLLYSPVWDCMFSRPALNVIVSFILYRFCVVVVCLCVFFLCCGLFVNVLVLCFVLCAHAHCTCCLDVTL